MRRRTGYPASSTSSPPSTTLTHHLPFPRCHSTTTPNLPLQPEQYHPDVKTGNEAKFQAISEAYAILGHADSRRAYDASMTASGPSYQYQHHTSGGATAGGYYPYQDIETASTRRARANYAWQHTRTHSPRWAHPGRHNPFDHHHHSHPNAQHQQHRETFRTTAEQDYFERMQAREAWKASNMSSGARKRAMYEAEKMAKEEDLRNSSSIVRAFQAVGMFLGVLWITGSFKASAQEKVDGEGEGDR